MSESTPSPARIGELVQMLIDDGASLPVAVSTINEAFSIGMKTWAERVRAKDRKRQKKCRDSRQQLVGSAIPANSDAPGMSRDTRDTLSRDTRDTCHVTTGMSRDTASRDKGGTIGGVLANGREKVEEVEVCTSPAPTPVKPVPPDPTPEIDTRSPFEKFPILTDPVFLGLTPADDEVEL